MYEKYPLLTTKYFEDVKLKKALTKLNNVNLSKQDKNVKLLAVKKL
jgi:hypothetical protein